MNFLKIKCMSSQAASKIEKVCKFLLNYGTVLENTKEPKIKIN